MGRDKLVTIFKGIAIFMFKGIAIFMVFVVHYTQPFYLTNLERAIPRLGQMGCQIFFVISGYTLCLSLERKPVDLKRFMCRRLSKIAPGYWTMIIVYFILGTMSLSIFENNIFGTSRDGKDIVINFLLLNGIFSGNANNKVVRGGWFVGTIMIIYILTPLLFKIFNFDYQWWKKKRIWLFPLIIFIISFVIQVICGNFDERYICLNNNFMYFSFINQLPSFCLGFSLYALSKTRNKLVHYTYIITGVAFGISFFLFFLNIKYAFVFVPTLFSVGVVCLFKLCQEAADKMGGGQQYKTELCSTFNN